MLPSTIAVDLQGCVFDALKLAANMLPWLLSSRFFALGLLVSGVFCDRDWVEVRISTGRIRGETRVQDGRAYRLFRGIPYAEPPVGVLRFHAPLPKLLWEEVLDAVEYGPSCPQNISAVSRYYPDYVVRIPDSAMEISEDCLTLNIFSPVRGGEPSAVMVWIHGGSSETGQGSGYDASALAVRGGVVVVTINYRLNVFGFLSTNDENAPGNFGLLDQQLALQWVHDNIAAFGGDPSRVTLFGQSAGGVAAMLHLTAPRSRPFFHRVIAHSGISGGMIGPSRQYMITDAGSQAKRYAQRIGLKADCTHRGRPIENTEHLVACLREKPTHVLLRAGLQVATEEIIPKVWLPVFDGNFYRWTPSYSAESFDRFDIVAGVTSGDGSPLLELLPDVIPNSELSVCGLSQADFDTVLSVFVPLWQNDNVAQQSINFEYRNWTLSNTFRPLDRILQAENIMLDYNFVCRIRMLENIYGGAKSRRMFVFDHRREPRVRYPFLAGAPHSEELPYVFGLPFNSSGIGHLFTDEERVLSQRVITYWSNIAKSGDPNVNPDPSTSAPDSNLTYWPEYGDSENYLLLQLDGSSVGQGYRKDKVMFWTDYLPSLTAAADEYCSSTPTEKPDCGPIFFGEGLGFKLTREQAETLIEVFMFLIIALLAIVVIVFGAALGYKFRNKEEKAAFKGKGGVKHTNGEINTNAAFQVNEGFTNESEDTKM